MTSGLNTCISVKARPFSDIKLSRTVDPNSLVQYNSFFQFYAPARTAYFSRRMDPHQPSVRDPQLKTFQFCKILFNPSHLSPPSQNNASKTMTGGNNHKPSCQKEYTGRRQDQMCSALLLYRNTSYTLPVY